MCVSAAVIAGASLVASGVGTMASIGAAKANARSQQMVLDEQRKQLREEREIARMQAQEAEIQRLSDFRRQRASNAAALAASGVRENISFLQGIMPAEERALQLDIASIRMGDAATQNRLATQIRVNRFSRSVAGYNARMQTIGAVAGFVGDAARIAKAYNDVKGG